MVVNSEQIRFHQKGQVETEERPLSQSRIFICSEKNSLGGVLFEVRLIQASDFGVGARVTLLIVRF